MRDGRATRRATVGRARCVSVDAYRERPDERGGSDCFGHHVVRDAYRARGNHFDARIAREVITSRVRSFAMRIAREVITSMRVSRAR